MNEGNWLGLTDGRLLRLDDTLKTRAELRIGNASVAGVARLSATDCLVAAGGMLAIVSEKAGELVLGENFEAPGVELRALRLAGQRALVQTSAVSLALVDVASLEATATLTTDRLIAATDLFDTTTWYGTTEGHVRRLNDLEGPHESMIPLPSECEALIALSADSVVARTSSEAFLYDARKPFEPPVRLASAVVMCRMGTGVLVMDSERLCALCEGKKGKKSIPVEGIPDLASILFSNEQRLLAAGDGKLTSFRIERRADAVIATYENAVDLPVSAIA